MTKWRDTFKREAATLILVCVGAALLGFILGDTDNTTATASSGLSSRQSEEKTITIFQRDDELVDFGDLRIGNVSVTPNQKFDITSLGIGPEKKDDWLENLEFTMKNKSDKQITAIVFELQFPDTTVKGSIMVYRGLGLGVPPGSSSA